jgi:hypothetical protein
MSRIETIDLAMAVDELAELKAAIAPLQERETVLKELLKGTGRDRIDGTGHTAVISLSERETIDTKALKLDHPKLVEPYLNRSLVTTLKLTARKTH